MNKRIKELADQIEEMYKLPSERELAIEKFAELIVLECEQVSLKNSHRDDDMGAIIARQIKEHFGVEE